MRKPESAADFSKRVEKATGQKYDQATISRLETGGRNWLLEDVDAFAAVDPERRGRAWLAGYTDESVPPKPDAASGKRAIPDLEGGAAVTAEQFTRSTAAQPGKKKQRPA